MRRSRRAVRHDDQQLAHTPEHEPHQRVESVLGVHVDRRQRLQPRLAEPDEVPPRGRRARRRGLLARGRRHVPRAGDRGRQLLVSDARDRAERQGVPPTGARLRKPRCFADGAWASLRLRRGARLRSCDHRVDDGPRVSQVGRDREPDGAVRGLQAERGRDDRRHGAASRRRREHPGPRRDPCRPAVGLPPGMGRRPQLRRGARLPQRAGDRARHRQGRSAS